MDSSTISLSKRSEASYQYRDTDGTTMATLRMMAKNIKKAREEHKKVTEKEGVVEAAKEFFKTVLYQGREDSQDPRRPERNQGDEEDLKELEKKRQKMPSRRESK